MPPSPKQAVALQRTERMESMYRTLTGAHEVVINTFYHHVTMFIEFNKNLVCSNFCV